VRIALAVGRLINVTLADNTAGLVTLAASARSGRPARVSLKNTLVSNNGRNCAAEGTAPGPADEGNNRKRISSVR